MTLKGGGLFECWWQNIVDNRGTWRPPYISVNRTMYSAIDMAFIQGSMCNDWENSTSASQRANTVLQNACDGQIILLHDFNGNNNTVQALPTIIEGLKNQGYQFVTLSELFRYKGKNANAYSGIYGKRLLIPSKNLPKSFLPAPMYLPA